MTEKVIIPLGWGAGLESDLNGAILSLTILMLGHRSDLHELGRRSPQDAPALEAQADLLERYALALLFMWYQAESPARRSQELNGRLSHYLEMADKYGIALPPELEAQRNMSKEST